MNPIGPEKDRAVAGFRFKLFAAIMLVVGAVTAVGLFIGQRNIAANVERDLQQNFQAEVTALHKLHELRDSALAERCRILSDKPRIHAALEDNALDLLYASAKDELRDLMQPDSPLPDQSSTSLHATFYRFLDSSGVVLPPPNLRDVGRLSRTAEAQLNFARLPEKQQTGYIFDDRTNPQKGFYQVVTVPIFSTETGRLISALVVGFNPFEGTGPGMKSGIWSDGVLHFPVLSESGRRALSDQIARAFRKRTPTETISSQPSTESRTSFSSSD